MGAPCQSTDTNACISSARARAQVVIGAGDPNPLVASEGIATLEKAGIKVCKALCTLSAFSPA